MTLKELQNKVKMLDIKLRGIDGSIQFIREFIESKFHEQLNDIKDIHHDLKALHKTYDFKASTLLEAKKLISQFNEIKKYNADIVRTLKEELHLRVTRKEPPRLKIPAKKKKEIIND